MTIAQTMAELNSIVDGIFADPGLRTQTTAADISDGADAARLMNSVLATAIQRTGVNADNVITPEELMLVSDAIRADSSLYAQFLEGHGDDEWNAETGFHLVQGDGGSLTFQGRQFINTIADAIYHTGFAYANGHFYNEDGNQNEEVADVAGWLNFFLNGQNTVFGSSAGETLYSGTYSAIFADAANERFEAGAGDDKIWAGDGNDLVFCGNGNDRSGGGTGNDRLYGGRGDDELGGDEGNDLLRGQKGNDRLWGGSGADRVEGGVGEDELGGGTGNDLMYGGDDDDLVWGDEGDDFMYGDGGNDVMGGGGGGDRMFGGSGADDMSGGAGADRMYGDAGNDTMWLGDQNDLGFGGAGDDEIGGGLGNDRIFGGGGNDLFYGDEGNDRLNGKTGNDIIYGGSGHDVVVGGNGTDDLSGGDGNDVVNGGNGDDSISGGNGSDALRGGAGRDQIYGWDEDNARDTFIFSSGDSGLTTATIDQVYGFVSGEDRIDLSAIGGLAFSGDALAGGGTASVAFDGDFVLVDADGNGQADMMIELVWVNSVVASDFIL